MTSVERAYGQFCAERFPLPSDADVSELEKRINVRFPSEYRQFLLRYNGGDFTEPVIVPPDESWPRDRLTFLHGIRASHRTAELGRERDLALWEDNDPPEIVPIGYTLMGNFLWLIVADEGRGNVVLRTFDESYLLADTIWEFFDLLEAPSP